MLRYTGAAIVLKLSSFPPFDQLYRYLGNKFSAKGRMKRLPEFYYDRIRALASLNEKYGFVKDGDHILELGTGWLHWDAIATKLQFDVSATLYDVWDCRQFNAIKQQAEYLKGILNDLPIPKPRANEVLNAITTSKDIDEMYSRLNFKYICANNIPSNLKYDFIVSGGVLEHVENVPKLVTEFVDVMKTDAHVLHVINMADHLTYYGSKCHQKKYLEIPKMAWVLLFNNSIQHQNRWQKSDYYNCFESHGLKLIHESCANINDMISCDLDPDDARCIWVRCLHKLTS